MRVRFLTTEIGGQNLGPFEVERFMLTDGIVFDAMTTDEQAQYLLLPSRHYVLVVDERKKETTV